MDVDAGARDALYQLVVGGGHLNSPGSARQSNGNRCPFVEQGTIAIRWDGEASPCLGLLHDYKTYLYRFERFVQHYSVGNLAQQSLAAIWNAPEHLSFRDRAEVRFLPLHALRRLRFPEVKRRRLFRQLISELRRLPLGAGRNSLSLTAYAHSPIGGV
jgi:hypothetical protein